METEAWKLKKRKRISLQVGWKKKGEDNEIEGYREALHLKKNHTARIIYKPFAENTFAFEEKDFLIWKRTVN